MVTKLKTKLKRGFKIPQRSVIMTALRLKSKTFLVSCIMWAFTKLSKKNKISLLLKIDRAPNQSSKNKKRKSKRKASRTATKKRKKSKKASRKASRKGTKTITIKMKNGKRRKQKVKVLSSGKFRFIKN